MANEINLVVGAEVTKQLDGLLSKLNEVDKKINETARNFIGLNAGVTNVKTPAALTNQAVNNSAATADMQRYSKTISQLEGELQKLNRVRAVSNKMTAQEAVNQRILNKNALDTAKSNSQLIGSYEKLSLELNKQRANAKNLGATYGEQSKQFLNAAKGVTELDTRLKKIDETLGQSQRNVGNYKSGFNGLGNSINQLTRELPAFTFSAQTGFLALSNNIPMLTDQIGMLVQKNKELKASGEPTVSVFKQILSGVFSVQTVMGVGILLFTLYGKQIGEFTAKLFANKKGLDVNTESIKAFAAATKEANTNSVAELNTMKSNLAIARNINLPLKEREIAYKNLNDQYPFYFENLSKEEVLAGKTAAAENALTIAILARAKANAAVTKITENYSKILDSEMLILEARKQLDIVNQQILTTEKKLQSSSNISNSQGITLSQTYERRKKLTQELNVLVNDKVDLEIINNKLTSFALTNQEKAIGLDYKAEKALKKKTEAKRADLALIAQDLKSAESYLQTLEEQKKLMQETQKEVSDTSKEYAAFQKVIDGLQQSIDLITDPSKVIKASTKGIEEQNDSLKSRQKIMEDLRKETDAYLKSITEGFLKDAGLGSLEFFTKLDEFGTSAYERLMIGATSLGEKVAITFNGMADVAQEVFAFMNQQSEMRYQSEIARLSSQRDVSIMFAGESTTARAEIERQYEERRKNIERKKAEEQKKMSLFNAIIDTAQAVVSALPNIPLSILIGAIGAAQIAMIASQPIPAFAEGGTHTQGGILLMNDAKGSNYRETMVTPDGKISQPTGRNVLMNAPKGTEIYTPEQWQKQLDGLLMSNGILPMGTRLPQNVQNANGITMQQMESIMKRHANKQGDSVDININENGLGVWKTENGRRTELLNSRLRIKGRNV